jgi:uncharacterized membrane protein YoaK (UPF0700 family)
MALPHDGQVSVKGHNGPGRKAGLVGILRRIVGAERSDAADAQLGLTLCLVAGAVNAGGLLAVGQYTSHMSGIVSALAGNLVLGRGSLIVVGLGSVLSFVAGAACSAFLINWGRRHQTPNQYALPLLVEAALLLGFGLIGHLRVHGPHFGTVAVPLLCFIMGLQNAIITKISRARIRTTHVTGMVTDLGIELGKLFYRNRTGDEDHSPVVADRQKLKLLGSLLCSFVIGGVVGALGFKSVGFLALVPLAVLLLLLAGLPMADNLVAGRHGSLQADRHDDAEP